ncbi:hypothetical protein BC835DRAFT_15850 [Cytidiella melzeri]|nr:hypothetical protein BC835DRAFT_15850 [Cytidiella melzeri]
MRTGSQKLRKCPQQTTSQQPPSQIVRIAPSLDTVSMPFRRQVLLLISRAYNRLRRSDCGDASFGSVWDTNPLKPSHETWRDSITSQTTQIKLIIIPQPFPSLSRRQHRIPMCASTWQMTPMNPDSMQFRTLGHPTTSCERHFEAFFAPFAQRTIKAFYNCKGSILGADRGLGLHLIPTFRPMNSIRHKALQLG